MADNSVDSQGTGLYLSTDGTSLIRFNCPTDITGLGFTTADIALNCLDAPSQTTRPGQKTISPFTVNFIYQQGSEIHEWILDLVNNPTPEIPYCIADSDGTADPTIAAGVISPPGGSGTATRTCAIGTGYIGSLTYGYGNGDVKRGSFVFTPQSQVNEFKAA